MANKFRFICNTISEYIHLNPTTPVLSLQTINSNAGKDVTTIVVIHPCGGEYYIILKYIQRIAIVEHCGICKVDFHQSQGIICDYSQFIPQIPTTYSWFCGVYHIFKATL